MSNPIRFRDFQRIVFFTGAGMSAESGVPTYRGSGGMWNEYNYEDYACQEAFERDPEKVWDFHDMRRSVVAGCEPNAGHRIVAEVLRERPGAAVVTQNIDGLHERSGASDVVRLHGSLWHVRCDREGVTRPDTTVPMNPRRCSCGAYWRPDIVWFGDALDQRVVRRARELLEQCDLLVSVGTSAVVFPAALLPRIAMERGVATVEINPDDTPVSELYQHRLRAKASEALAELNR